MINVLKINCGLIPIQTQGQPVIVLFIDVESHTGIHNYPCLCRGQTRLGNILPRPSTQFCECSTIWCCYIVVIGHQKLDRKWSCLKSASNESIFWFPVWTSLVVFYVQSTARSFRDSITVHYTTASPRKLLNIFGHIAIVNYLTRLHN